MIMLSAPRKERDCLGRWLRSGVVLALGGGEQHVSFSTMGADCSGHAVSCDESTD